MNGFRGTAAVARLALRRDRIILSIWVYGIAAATVGTAKSFESLYPTAASREAFASGLARNPALLVLTGPIFDLRTVGGLTVWRLGSLTGIAIALMNQFSVIRHTRAEEEAGRLDLLGATPMGRRAPLAAALAVSLGADLVIAVVVALALIVIGLPAAGSIALGVATAMAGACFAAVAAVCAQLTTTARAANGLAGGVLAVAFLLRAVGDSAGAAGPRWLSWLSPIGWSQQLRPFAGERWWVVALAGGFVLALAVTAFALLARRDLGAGLLADRAGPSHASAAMRGPWSLAWRLQRGSVVAWTVGVTLLSVAVGVLAQGVAQLVQGSRQLEDVFRRLGGGQQAVVDAYLSTSVGIVAIVVAAFAISSVLRLRDEETSGRGELTLSTATSRLRWAGGHVLVALVGSTVALAAAGVGAGLADGLRSHDVSHQLPRLFGAAMAQLPAVAVLAGVGLVLFGVAPRWCGAAWGVLALVLLTGELGSTLRLPQWLTDVSPFTHIPKLPGQRFTAWPLVVVTLVAIGLFAVGLTGLVRRDVG